MKTLKELNNSAVGVRNKDEVNVLWNKKIQTDWESGPSHSISDNTKVYGRNITCSHNVR